MHELGIAYEILTSARQAIAGREALRVTRLKVRIGRFQNVDRDSLDFAFRALARDETGFENAVLDMEDVEPAFACPDCGARGTLEKIALSCPACGGGNLHVEGADDLVLQSIEAEEGGRE